MLKIVKKWWKASAAGIVAGILNGLFGSGGGMAAVPMLKKSGLSVKEAHATSVFIMLILSVLSSFLYLSTNRLSFGDALVFIPGGVAGSLLGSFVFKRMNSSVLRRVFGGFVVFAALKILFGQVMG